MNTPRIATSAALFAGSVVIGLFLTGDLGAQTSSGVRNDFSNATLNDRYGFHTIAWRGRVPFAVSGFYRFDGRGNMRGQDVVSDTQNPPVVAQREYEGTYEVRPNGTGTLTLDIAPDFQPRGHFIIVEGGDAIEIVFAVEGNANAFTLRKQNTD